MSFYTVETIGYMVIFIRTAVHTGSIDLYNCLIILTEHINDHCALPGDSEMTSTNCCQHSVCVVTRLISHYVSDSVG